jgi:hypothetical protein
MGGYQIYEDDVPLGPSLRRRMLNELKVNHCEPVEREEKTKKPRIVKLKKTVQKAAEAIIPRATDYECYRCVAANDPGPCHHWWVTPQKSAGQIRDKTV